MSRPMSLQEAPLEAAEVTAAARRLAASLPEPADSVRRAVYGPEALRDLSASRRHRFFVAQGELDVRAREVVVSLG